jgi:hypothetical protein
MKRPKKAIDRIPALIAWVFIGYLVVVNSQYSVVAYADVPGMEHYTLNTLRLGYAIIAGAIFDFVFNSLRERSRQKEDTWRAEE